MSTISRQNSKKAIKRLAAQRFLYSQAKNLWAIVLLLSAVITPLLSVIAIFNPKLMAYTASASIFTYVIVGLVGIRVKELVRIAAETQEKFDCDVLGIPCNPLLYEIVDQDETVSDAAIKFFAKYSKDKLVDWYPKSLIKVDQTRATIEAQKINCWWDQSLRNNYIVIHIMVAFIISSSLIFLGLIQKLTLDGFILSVIIPVMPLIQITANQTYKNIEFRRKAMNNLKYAKSLLVRQRRGSIEPLEIRSLQDAIFSHRTSAPLVFDFVYWLSREVKERIMKDSTKR